VLLLGESGTGKGLTARLLHANSPRADQPFMQVDCGAIAASVFESELFGHERGAFTGASRMRRGPIELAQGGTLFLDEIGELPLELQPKLLRVLEAREVQRLGAREPRPTDVRVIAATNRDLRADVNSGRFRADLFYRLAVLEIRLPPLRERPDDLPLIVDHLLAAAPDARRRELTTPAFLAHLAAHRWTGNVRELRNYLDRCLALGVDLAPPPADPSEPAGAGVDASVPLREARDEATRRFERAYLEDLLRRSGDNLAAAARAAAVDRAYLYRLLWKHGLK